MDRIEFRGIAFRKLAMGDCVAMGVALNDAGKKWHSHVLSPDCTHNPFPGHYAVVVEDDTGSVNYIAEGDESFPEEDKVLVKLLHGDDILDAGKAQGGAPAAKASLVVAHVMDLQEKCTHWHHHMHFPDCAFNPFPGKWSIGVESPSAYCAESYPDEPVDTLREVEVIYFGNLDKA